MVGNICPGLDPHRGNISFLKVNDNLIDCHNP